ERAAPLLPQSLTRRDRALSLTPILLLTQRLTLVILLLALCERNLDLGATIFEVELQRHNRHATLTRLLVELVDLLTVQQQLALATRCVIRPGTVQILRNIGSIQPRFTAIDEHVPVDQ